MDLSVATAKITGNPGSSGWAQVHEFKPEEEDKLAKRGELFAVIATSNESAGVEGVMAGREILARLHEEYFGEMEKPAFYALKDALEKVIAEFSTRWGEVQIAGAAFVDGIVYSAVGGGAEAAVFRDGMLAKILVSEGSVSGVISASGYPKDGDIFLLATRPFFEIVPQGVIKAALEGQNVEQASEGLVPFIHARKDTGAVGAIIFKFSINEAFVSKLEPKGPELGDEGEISAPIIKEQESPSPAISKSTPSLYFEKTVSQISRLVSRWLPQKRIFVKPQNEEVTIPQNRKLAISVGTMLVLLLIVSIGFGIRQKSLKERKQTYESRLTEAKHNLSEAEKLYSLDPGRARELFNSARNLISAIEDEGVKDEDVQSVKKEIEDKEGQILGIYKATNELFVDLSILSSGLKGDDLASSDDNFFVLDKNGKKVVSVAFATKKTAVVAGPDQVSKADAIASYGDRIFILSGDGVIEVGEEAKKVVEKDWEGDATLYAYAGNLYLLDKSAKTIWRYPGISDGFAGRSKWNTQDLDVNLNNLAGISVDGSIWLLTNSGEIYRYSLGNKLTFSINELYPELASASAVYTNENLKYVYVLDRAGKRVVVIDKSGEYKAQYVGDFVAEGLDLAVSENAKKIILLTGTKLYSIDIKHL